MYDLKHPVIQNDRCEFYGKGKAIASFKATTKMLYNATGKPENDIALQCQALGAVTFNDDSLLPVQNGQPVQLSIRQFRYLPTRYHIQLPVVSP